MDREDFDNEFLEEDAVAEVFDEQPSGEPLENVSAAAGSAIDMPIEEQRKRAIALAGIAIALFFVGFLIGDSNGSDLEAAAAAGAKAGETAGAKVGKKAGYEDGFAKGEETAFKAAYSKAYRAANPDGSPNAAKAYEER